MDNMKPLSMLPVKLRCVDLLRAVEVLPCVKYRRLLLRTLSRFCLFSIQKRYVLVMFLYIPAKVCEKFVVLGIKNLPHDVFHHVADGCLCDLSVCYPSAFVLCGFDAFLDPLHTLGARMDVGIPEVNRFAFFLLVDGTSKLRVEAAPRLKEDLWCSPPMRLSARASV